MAVYQWSQGETVTATKLNSWSAEIEAIKDAVDEAVVHEPKIQNGNWWVWNQETEQYEDTHTSAHDTITVSSSKTGGVNTVEFKSNGTTVNTITVNDGTGTGDMLKSEYDDDDTVSEAGGIVPYVESQIPDVPTKTSELTNDGDGTNPFLTSHQSLTGKEDTGYLTIAGVRYQLRLGTSGANGFITIELE